MASRSRRTRSRRGARDRGARRFSTGRWCACIGNDLCDGTLESVFQPK